MAYRRRKTFQYKLLSYFWCVLILAFLFSGYFYKVTVGAVLTEEAIASAREKLDVAVSLLGSQGPFESERAFDLWLKSLGNMLHARLTYISNDGVVVSDSDVAFEKLSHLENHGNREEIVAVRERDGVGLARRYSATIKRHLIYVAKSCNSPNPSVIPSGFMRVSIPEAIPRAKLYHVLPLFGAALVGSFIVTALISYVLTRRVERPIETIIAFVQEVSRGNYRRRISHSAREEFPDLVDAINLMVDAIEAHLRLISKTSEELEIILNEMREAVILLGEDGKIRKTNRLMRQEVIPGREPLEGRYPIEVIPSPEFQERCEEVYRTKLNNLTLELSFGGKSYDVSLSRLEREGQFFGYVVVFHDISEIRRVEQIRRDFVANVSHALRTPLASIRGYAETVNEMLERGEHEQSREFLEVILKNTHYMISLVDKLLQLAHVESSTREKNDEAVDVVRVAEATWRVCLPLAREKGITLEIETGTSRAIAQGNEEQLHTVFQHLYENALRYQPPGLPLRLHISARGGDTLQVCLEDRGPGVEKAYRERIFERFYRIEKDRSKERSAVQTGLGLAICRHIVKNHGGKIWVEGGEGGRGARFCFTLPRKQQKDGRGAEERPHE